mmetsp:Transcript_18566/g.41153  ORF Transcript_18566/g.41153 Transcript_18566/m.41153 type:complete len:273 (+) Transcript_18566:760-1578(+)
MLCFSTFCCTMLWKILKSFPSDIAGRERPRIPSNGTAVKGFRDSFVAAIKSAVEQIAPLVMTVMLRVVVAYIALASGYSSGGPSSRCSGPPGAPGHGSQQGGTGGYSISLMDGQTAVTQYTPGQSYTVQISGDTFKGFMVNANGGSLAAASGQMLSGVCLTHSSPVDKTIQNFAWKAPASGNVTFGVTIVQSYFVYYRGIGLSVVADPTAVVDVDESAGSTTEPAADSTTTEADVAANSTTTESDTTTAASAISGTSCAVIGVILCAALSAM